MWLWGITAVLLLYGTAVAAVAPVVNVALVVSPLVAAPVPTNPFNSTGYLCASGHPYASAACAYQRRIDARGGFTVGRVTGVKQSFAVFSASTRTQALQLATRIPRGDYGNFSAVIATTSRTLVTALEMAAANVAVGAQRGLGNTTGPCSLLNVGIADTAQFTNPNTSTAWYAQSFGALVPNAFGDAASKLVQALYAEEKLRTGRSLTFTVLSGKSSSSKAIVADIYNSVMQSGAGIEWHGTNYEWPDRAVINGTAQTQDDWNAALIPWASALATMDTKPDLVYVAGLAAEVNVSRAILVGWMTADTPWRPLMTLFAGGAVPPNPDELFIDTIFARQWNRAMRGIERDVKDIQGAAEPWISDTQLGIQAPEVFARDMEQVSGLAPSMKADPLGPAILALALVWLQKAIQAGCRDIVSIDECDGEKIAIGLASVNSPSVFGTIRSVNGQNAVSPFFLGQFADDLTQTYLSPLGSSNGTLHWSRSWQQLTVKVERAFDGAPMVLSFGIALASSISVIGLYGWVVLGRSKHARETDSRSSAAVIVIGATIAGMSAIYCTQLILIFSDRRTNMPADQQLVGYQSLYLGICAMISTTGAAATAVLLSALTGSRDAKLADDGLDIEQSATRSSNSSSRHARRASSDGVVVVTPSQARPEKPPYAPTRCRFHAWDLRLRMCIVAFPTAMATTLCCCLLVLSVSADAIPTLSLGAVAGAGVLALAFTTAALVLMFAKQRHGGLRTAYAVLSLAVADWVPAVIIIATTTWSRYVLQRASLPASVLTSQGLFTIGCVLLFVMLITFILVMRYVYTNRATQLQEAVMTAVGHARNARTRLVARNREFYDIMTLALVSTRKGAPPAYFNQLKDLPGETAESRQLVSNLQFDTVVKCQPAMLCLMTAYTDPRDRQGVEFLWLMSFLVSFTGGDTPHERKRKRHAHENEIYKLIANIRDSFAEGDEANLGDEINRKFLKALDIKQFEHLEDPLMACIDEIHKVLPEVQAEAMKTVRGNAWARVLPQHRKRLAFICDEVKKSEAEVIQAAAEQSDDASSAQGSPALFRTTRTLAHTARVPSTVVDLTQRRPAIAVGSFHALPPPATSRLPYQLQPRHHARNDSDMKEGVRSPAPQRSPEVDSRALPGAIPEGHAATVAFGNSDSSPPAATESVMMAAMSGVVSPHTQQKGSPIAASAPFAQDLNDSKTH